MNKLITFLFFIGLVLILFLFPAKANLNSLTFPISAHLYEVVNAESAYNRIWVEEAACQVAKENPYIHHITYITDPDLISKFLSIDISDSRARALYMLEDRRSVPEIYLNHRWIAITDIAPGKEIRAQETKKKLIEYVSKRTYKPQATCSLVESYQKEDIFYVQLEALKNLPSSFLENTCLLAFLVLDEIPSYVTPDQNHKNVMVKALKSIDDSEPFTGSGYLMSRLIGKPEITAGDTISMSFSLIKPTITWKSGWKVYILIENSKQKTVYDIYSISIT